MRDEKWRQFSKQVVYGAVLLIFGFLTLKVSANGVGPYTHYVNATNPTPAWPYTNWSTAAQRIQDAVNAASAGSTVLVASGVYNSGGVVWEDSGLTNRVLIDKPLTLKSVSGAQATFIVGNSSTGLLACGDSAVRCLAIVAAPVLVSGFTLTNGHTRASGAGKSIMGGGVWTTNAGPVGIADCRITGCAALQEGGGGYGGIYGNCIISGNAAWNGGGVSQGLTVRCEVSENRGYSGAGGILHGTSVLSRIAFNRGGTMGGGCSYARVDRCTVERNAVSGEGGGVHYSDVRSSVIICNTSSVAGGGSYGSWLFNCTIVSNRSQSGGGVSSSYLTNCIVYYNTAASNINADSTSTGRVNCIVLPPGITWSGTITNEPRFAARSFRLRGDSPCINTGTNMAGLASARDLDGRERIIYERVDLGAYEYAALVNDFDRDGKSDVSVWRSYGVTNWGLWAKLSSGSSTQWVTGSNLAGMLEPYPAVYEQDSGMLVAAYHKATWNWYVFPFSSPATQWGAPGMTPVYGDYNGDGLTDIALYELASGKWYIRTATSAVVLAWGKQWGYNGTWPVPGDYDADGVWDLAVYDFTTGDWYIMTLANKLLAWRKNWGFAGAVPVWGDYDGDGCFDLAVYHKSAGRWYIRSLKSSVPLAWNRDWGYNGAMPVPGDYNGDGIYDLTVMDVAASRWYTVDMSGNVLRWNYYLQNGAAVQGIRW